MEGRGRRGEVGGGQLPTSARVCLPEHLRSGAAAAMFTAPFAHLNMSIWRWPLKKDMISRMSSSNPRSTMRSASSRHLASGSAWQEGRGGGRGLRSA